MNRTAISAAVALLLSSPAMASLSLQFEGGATETAHPTDCTYADRHEPGYHDNTKFLSGAGGFALRWDTDHYAITGGWRSLGNQKITGAPVIPDVDYAPCGVSGKRSPSPKPVMWDSYGSERQWYVSVGRKYPALGGYIVPTLGLGVNTIRWAMTQPTSHNGGPQHHPEPLAGVDYERGRIGVGVYLVGTKPYTESGCEPYFPAQGPVALYARVTFRLPE